MDNQPYKKPQPNTKNMKQTDYLGSLAKGLKVIECFGFSRSSLSITEASRLSGLNMGVTRRSLLTLHAEGYVDYNGKYFSLTPKVLNLGMSALSSMPLPNLVQPWLDTLAQSTKESYSLGILDGTEIVFIARSIQKKVFSVNLFPGSRLPTYCTAAGRVLLAHLPYDEAYDILQKSPITDKTGYTLTDVNQIMETLTQIKQQGYCIINQEMELGLLSIAVPVLTAKGICIGGITVGVFASVYTPDKLVSVFLPNMLNAQSSLQKILH